jgi:putative redox protein
MKATVNWIENYKLEGETNNGKQVFMDSGENAEAASPAQLVLQALAGCTMMDIILILTKSRKKIDKFWIDVDANEAETYPKVFTNIHLTYNISGRELTLQEVERAVKLSEEKYCRVHAMLEDKVKITSSLNLIK